MSSASYQWTQHLIVSSLVLLSLGSFVMYYKPTVKPFSTYKVSQKEDAYHNILSIEDRRNMSKVLNPNRTSEKQISPHPNQTMAIQPKDEDTEDDELILIWLWPFGQKFDLSCSEFNIKGCHLTDDRSLYNKSHAVLFHHRDINWELSNMPQQPRPWFQKWVWFNMESPGNSHQIPELNDLFNLTNSYRLDSNIPVRYGYLAPVTHEDESFKMPVKDKLVCWVVSNWNASDTHTRVQFYNELKKHIKIERYGKAFGRQLNGDEFSKVISSCKFYLSFENSIYKDYITEKLYNPMKMGTVPIVLGPSRRNYEEHVPGDSFVHVDDFATPKELAERLIYLHNNHTEYFNYFHWKKRFKVNSVTCQHNACRLCMHLQLHKGYQSFHDLNKWFWAG